MIWLRTDAPEFFSDLGDVLRLFYGDVAVSLEAGETVDLWDGDELIIPVSDNENGVDIVADKEVFHILVHGAFIVVVRLVRLIAHRFATHPANIADRAESHVGTTQKDSKVVPAARTNTDRAHVDLSAGRNRAVQPER